MVSDDESAGLVTGGRSALHSAGGVFYTGGGGSSSRMCRHAGGLLCVLALVATGCTAGAGSEDSGIASRVSYHTIQQVVDGVSVDRGYTIHVPPGWDTSAPLPLLFAFHGAGGMGDFMVEPLDEAIRAGTFVGVYPDGIAQSWNLGKEESTADDVAFVESILDALEGTPGMDTTNPVALGYSNGAGLVNMLAIDSDRFVSIGPMATQLLADKQPQPGGPAVSVMQLHGTNDNVIPYDGSVSEVDHDFLPAEESAAVWAAHNGCSPTATESASGPYTRMEWEQCSTGTRVVHYRLDGVGHDIPWDVEGDTWQTVVDFLLSTRP